MKKLVFLLMAIFVASSAYAVIDPDDNSMGLFYDLTGDTVVQNMESFGELTLHLILCNPTDDSVGGFEAGLTFDGPASSPTVSFPNPQALNIGSATNMIVGLGTPTMTEEATLLASLVFYYTGTGAPLNIYLSGSTPSSADPDYPVVVFGGDTPYIQVTDMTAPPGMAAAGVNNEVIATENMSFDNVKSLYR